MPGTLPLEGNAELSKKLSNLVSDSERIKLLMLYCIQADDVFLVRAAAGALATMSYDPGVISRIVAVRPS